MQKTTSIQASPFLNLKNIEYFLFEEDFVEENVRCIPMIVRFKMDAVGIKLKLNEWVKFTTDEKVQLALMPCTTVHENKIYRNYLNELIYHHTGHYGGHLMGNVDSSWKDELSIPVHIQQRVGEENKTISQNQWQSLTDLQRFALTKLCRKGHESKNFVKALQEFGIYSS